MTTTLFFRFENENAGRTALQADGYYIPEEIDPVTKQIVPGYYKTADLGWALDVIGIIYNDDAVIDPDTGRVITPPTPMPGWHINFAGNFNHNLDQYKIEVEHPYRKFL